ncbi:MAG TPA: 30S ribosomal protein S1 [Actinomycetota bacterium]|nr:30S ribosomal protein S1 [Actinomycetota bacterium]
MSPQATQAGSTDRETAIVFNDVGTTEEELMAAIDATIKPFSDGDLVSGTIVKIDKEEVLVDIGYKSEGVIPARELSIRNDVDPSEIVKIGEQIEALVLQKEDKEGRLILSKKRASYERAWGRIEDIKRAGGVVNGTVIEQVKGGLIVDIGLRGFLPASLVDLRRVRDLQSFVGKEIECKIIELDKNRNNVVLSRRAFLEETHSEQRKEFLENLKPGEKRTGVVSSIVNFGAFVDLGGVDGLIHVSELSWKHVDHPTEVVQVGEEIEVEVLNVELERDRVSLSLKNTQEDPWQAFARSHSAGDVVKGKVTKLVPFGAFVQVADGIEGLVHISELSEGHIELPDQVVQLDEEAEVKIIDVDLERRRISLSLKQALPGAVAIYAPSLGEGEIKKEEAEAPGSAEGADFEREQDAATETPDAEATSMPSDEVPAEAPAAAETEIAAPAASVGAEEEIAAEIPASEPEAKAADEVPELEGELLDTAPVASEESLESIVEEMKKDRT